MSDKKFSTRLSVLLFIAILFISTFTGLIIYRNDIRASMSIVSCDTLKGIIEQQRFAFFSKLIDQQSTLKTYAAFLARSELTEQELLTELNLIAKNSSFSYVSFVTTDGETLENTGKRINVSDRDYFIRALAGETVISDPVTSKITSTNIVTFATPILHDETVVAVLAGIYDVKGLSELLLPSFDNNGYTYIVTNEGQIVVKTENSTSLELYDNLFEKFKKVEFSKHDDYDTILANVYANKPGHAEYTKSSEVRLMHYDTIGINEWSIFTIVPENIISQQAISVMNNTTWLMVGSALLLTIASLYFFKAQKKHVKDITKIAFVDSLTGVANRKRFKLTATEILASSNNTYAFIILDIDGFKVLNDTLGYETGDMLLICIANILKKYVRNTEFFGRCDSDEYFILLSYIDDNSIKSKLKKIISEIEKEFREQIDSAYNLVICAGVYVITTENESINMISDKARHAHKLIKGSQESGISFYNDEIRKQIIEEKDIENKMHIALENDEFILYLQPKYYLDDEKIYGAEALVRWNTGQSVIVYPDKFIPVFEKNGFITRLDMYMLGKVCQCLRTWIDLGLTPIPVSINFSRLHLKNKNFVDDIAAVVQSYQISPNLIEVELTENTMLYNEAVLIDVLFHLHEHGFTLSMDDFGSGYSSLGLLKNLPVDVIKLDKTFFTEYTNLARAKTVIANVISMAKGLGIKTVAEGVETLENIELLKELGCDIVQGYYYAKPMEALALNKLLPFSLGIESACES